MKRRGQAGRAIKKSGLPSSQRHVLLDLLEVCDNDTGVVPEWLTPSLKALAAGTGLSKSRVSAALNHLDYHRWIGRERSTGGRGNKTIYTVLPDGLTGLTDCDCPKETRNYGQPREPGKGPKTTPERVPKRGPKGSQRGTSFPRSEQVSHEGHQQGEEREGPARHREHSKVLGPVDVIWPWPSRPPVGPLPGPDTCPACSWSLGSVGHEMNCRTSNGRRNAGD
ncbi:MAG: hypothetical protein JWO67_2891 [Streptosporangiaceae bacterium]|nr:hypothetical protein [Streptosporangiaceae bacterium]